MSLAESSKDVVLSERVYSVEEVGGHIYKCQCDSPTARDCRLFKIGGMIVVVTTVKFLYPGVYVQ